MRYQTGAYRYSYTSKKLWKVINDPKGRKSLTKSQCNINANSFNEFFNTVGKDTVSHIDNRARDPSDIFWNCNKSVHSFVFNPITVDSVCKHMLKIGDDSSVDVLGFVGKLLFLPTDIIAPIICKFYNAS